MAREAGGGEVGRGGVDRRDCEKQGWEACGFRNREVDVNLVKYGLSVYRAWCESFSGIFSVLLISREIKPLRMVTAIFRKCATLLGPSSPASSGVSSGHQAVPYALIYCCCHQE